jgi:hypothetical protein
MQRGDTRHPMRPLGSESRQLDASRERTLRRSPKIIAVAADKRAAISSAPKPPRSLKTFCHVAQVSVPIRARTSTSVHGFSTLNAST